MILAVLLAVGYVILKYDKFQVTSFDEGDIKVNEGANQEQRLRCLEEIPEKDSWKREHMRTASL